MKVSPEGAKKTNGFRYQGLIVLKPLYVIIEVIQIDVKEGVKSFVKCVQMNRCRDP